jgi:hypothetical protein
MTAAFAVTLPARLWVRYGNPRPSERAVVALNIVDSPLLCTAFVSGVRSRRGSQSCSSRRSAPDLELTR